MNTDLLQAGVRKILTLAAGFLIAKGALKETQVDVQTMDFMVAVAMIFVTSVWTWAHQKKLLNTPPPATTDATPSCPVS